MWDQTLELVSRKKQTLTEQGAARELASPTWVGKQCAQGRCHKGTCVSHQEGLPSSELAQRSKAENSNSPFPLNTREPGPLYPGEVGNKRLHSIPTFSMSQKQRRRGASSLFCSKCWLVSVPGPSFKGQHFTKSSLPTAAIESSPMGYFYSDSCILLHCVQKEVPGHLG